MRFVVTGASSFLGKALILKLKENGHEVTAFRHSYGDAEDGIAISGATEDVHSHDDNINNVYNSVTAARLGLGNGGDAESSETALPRSCDVWVHFAWAGIGSKGRNDADIQRFNIVMSMDALEKAIELDCKSFVFAGSQAEYGRAQDGGLKKEDGELMPVSRYGVAKLLFSKLAKTRINAYNAGDGIQHPMRFVHARLFSVYGPGDHEGSLISNLIRSVKNGERLRLSECGQQWNYLYIDDAIRALYMLCTGSADGIYNIGSLDTRPLREYIYEAVSLLSGGEDPDKYLVFGARPANAEGSADLSPDITRIRALGFEPEVSFADGIRKTAGK